jgi:hypothetical protein
LALTISFATGLLALVAALISVSTPNTTATTTQRKVLSGTLKLAGQDGGYSIHGESA